MFLGAVPPAQLILPLSPQGMGVGSPPGKTPACNQMGLPRISTWEAVRMLLEHVVIC